MIPDHLIDKAVHAAGENWVLTFEWEHDKLHAQVRAALEAVAADIWDDAIDATAEQGTIQIPDNPYRASEGK